MSAEKFSPLFDTYIVYLMKHNPDGSSSYDYQIGIPASSIEGAQDEKEFGALLAMIAFERGLLDQMSPEYRYLFKIAGYGKADAPTYWEDLSHVGAGGTDAHIAMYRAFIDALFEME